MLQLHNRSSTGRGVEEDEELMYACTPKHTLRVSKRARGKPAGYPVFSGVKEVVKEVGTACRFRAPLLSCIPLPASGSIPTHENGKQHSRADERGGTDCIQGLRLELNISYRGAHPSRA